MRRVWAGVAIVSLSMLPALASANHDRGNGCSQDHLHRQNPWPHESSGGVTTGPCGGGHDDHGRDTGPVGGSSGERPGETKTAGHAAGWTPHDVSGSPVLLILAVPGPSSLVLVVVGAAALILGHRRKR